MKEEKKEESVIGNLILSICLLPITMFTTSSVLSIMWGWFVVPKFGLPELGLVDALGLSMVVNFIVNKPKKRDLKSKSRTYIDTFKYVTIIILFSLVALFVGWLLTLIK